MTRSVGFRIDVLARACLAGQAGPAVAQPDPGGRSSTAATPPFLDDLLPYKSADAMVRELQVIETRHDRASSPVLIELLRFELPIPAAVAVGVLEGLAGERLGTD